jgi:hypothetical protein
VPTPTRALALLAAAVAVGLPAVPGHAAYGCANDVELRNQWTAVPLPHTTGPVAMAQAGDDPCVMVATDTHRHVFRTSDGGVHWTAGPTLDADVVRPLTSTLAQGRVALAVAGGGLLMSTDGGASFGKAAGLDGVEVGRLVGDPTRQARVYATGRQASKIPPGTLPPAVPAPPTAGPSIWLSTDFGSSWNPLPASAAFAASNVSVDPADANLVWADSTSAGVWESDDGGTTFVSKDTTNARDVDTWELDGGGSVVLAATAKGLRRSVDGGDSWQARLADLDVRELVFETGHPAAFMMVAGGTVHRSANHGKSAHPENEGLPGGCDPRGLVADGSAPSTFLVTCASDGRVYRYRDDGSDWGWIDDGGDGGGFGLTPRLPHHDMNLLAQLDLPSDKQGESATIAFDGQLLYYAGTPGNGRIHRIDARTGSKAPDLKVGIKTSIRGLTYDSLHHLLYALGNNRSMYRIDLRTSKVKKLFQDPINTYSGASTSFSYDTAIGRFRAVFEGGGTLYEIDLHGKVVASCEIPAALLYQRSDGGVPGFEDGVVSGPSAVVASGDGGVYVQNEDDTTILRLDRSCQPLAVFSHRTFSEAPLENDQIACDTNTFDVPAIWIRDSEAKAAFAYEVPGGYCALATRLRVTTSPVVANVDRAPVCAELRLAGKDLPVGGEPVSLYVGRHEVGTAKTGANGVACVQYHPADFPEHVSPPAPKPGAQPIDRRDLEGVVANYLGTIAYRPARGAGHAVVTTFVPPLPLRPLPHPPVLAALPQGAIVAAPPPPLPVAPPQPPPPASQPQPLAQGHPGAQPGALGQPGAAAERQEDVEAADQSADVREFRARSFSPSPVPSSHLPVGVVGFACAAVLLEQRRRRSRVREVGA